VPGIAADSPQGRRPNGQQERQSDGGAPDRDFAAHGLPPADYERKARRRAKRAGAPKRKNKNSALYLVSQAKTSSLEEGKMGKAENCCDLSFRTGNR